MASKNPKKQRRKNITPQSAAIIGLLIRLPNVHLVGNEKQMAERMVKLGWLKKVFVKKLEKAGIYEYEANFPIYIPTELGLSLYQEKADLIKGISITELSFISSLAKKELTIYKNYLNRIKAEEKKSGKIGSTITFSVFPIRTDGI